MRFDSEAPDLASSSEAYARRFTGAVGVWFLEVQTRTLLALLGPSADPLRILDVGGGHAQAAVPLIEAGHEVLVYGSSPEAAHRLDAWRRAGRCAFHVGSLVRLPYRDRAFDAVICLRILAHLPRWNVLVSELCRVARQRVIVDYPARSSVNIAASMLFRLKLSFEGNTRPYRTFSRAVVRDAFARNGFRITVARPQFFMPMVVHRAMHSARLSRALEAPARVAQLTRFAGSPVIVLAERTVPDSQRPGVEPIQGER